MDKRLQDFSFKKGDYQRPTAKWVCGRAPKGTVCHAGPSDKGQCWAAGSTDCGNAHYECVPSSGKNGAACNRPRHLGGKCSEGPLPDGSCARPIPCQPIRNHRSIRNGLVFATVAATLGFATMIWSTPGWRNSFGSPGPLTHAHMSVLADQGPLDQQCGFCHSNTLGQLASLSPALSRNDAQATQSKRCISCHDLGSPATAMHAHGLAEAPDDARNVACASCHREHRGRDAVLGEMQPTQCQSCHAVGLESFADGHPRLLGRFYAHQPRFLTFDHAAHLEDYLALDDPWTSSACVHCHTPDRQASRMVLKGFDRACSECHIDAIYDEDDDSEGIIFLAGFDPGAASAEDAPPTIESLTPFMMFLLLGSDPDASDHDIETDLAAHEAIARGGENAADIRDRVARAVAQLFRDLGDRDALAKRLKRAVRTPLDDAQIDALIGRLLEYMPIRTAGEVWASGSSTVRSEPIVIGNWTRFDDTRRITYKPHAHADPFIKAWYDLAITLAETPDEKGIRSSVADAIAHLLTGSDAPGRCFNCHVPNVLETGDGARLAGAGRDAGAAPFTRKVAWTASGWIYPQRDLTRFTHAPHMGPVYGRCEECHKQSTQTAAAMQPAGSSGAAAPTHREFAPIELETCATCHVSQRAGDACSLCHQYHTTPAAPVFLLYGKPSLSDNQSRP